MGCPEFHFSKMRLGGDVFVIRNDMVYTLKLVKKEPRVKKYVRPKAAEEILGKLEE